MSEARTGQVSASAAEIYEEFFLPALFQQWAPRLVAAAQVERGQRVLDVACGTGVVARTLAERVGPEGSVVGIDINGGMLAVARQLAPEIVWIEGPAESLPFDDSTFDAVTSQFGLMFFQDPAGAIREMVRVLRPGGRLAIAVWDTLDNTPGYAAMASLLQRLFGDDTAASLHAPYSLGDPEALRSIFDEAGVRGVDVTTHAGTARFPSIRSWVFTDVKGWTAADMVDDDGFARLVSEAERELRPFVDARGRVSFSAPAHVATARKPDGAHS